MREGRRAGTGRRHSPQIRRRHAVVGDVGSRPVALSARHAELRRLAAAAIAAADPHALLARSLDAALAASDSSLPTQDPVYVVAAGKASAAMFRACEERLTIASSVIARGSHPLPDEASVDAGRAALALRDEARAAGAHLLLLLSGGASAMMAAPPDGVTLEMKREVTRRLLAAGVTIHELNAVRKHLSAVKGGRLAMGARCTTFALSDVTDDDPASIGSGPGVADASTMADAQRVLERAGVLGEMPELMRAIARAGETPKPGDAALADARFVLIGGRRTAMDGVVDAALERGLATIVLDEPIVGDAAPAGAAFARRAVAAAARIGGAVVIASGETTVRVRGGGTGGRNQEFALGAAIEVGRSRAVGRSLVVGERTEVVGLAVAAFGTDGVDGNSPAAGAIVDEMTIARARAAGFDPAAVLAANDSHALFQALGDAITTGPTGTNVGDVFIAWVS